MKTKHWHQYYDYDVPMMVHYPRFPVQSILHIAAVKFPSKAAMKMYNTEFTYTEIRARVLRFANALARLDVKQGDHVGLAMPNCPQYVISYYAILSLGAVVVNINPFYSKDQFTLTLKCSGVKTLITIDSNLPVVRPLVKEFDIKHVIVTKLTDFIKEFETSSAKSLDLEKGWHHLSSLLKLCSDIKVPDVVIHPYDSAMIQFTSGTTGIPKGVVLTHGNVVTSIIQFSLWCKPLLDSTTIDKRSLIVALPYFHINGNIIAMNWSLFNGLTQILFPNFNINEFIEESNKSEDFTILPAKPAMIANMIKHFDSSKKTIGRPIQWIHSIGAPMPIGLRNDLSDMRLFYTEGWGISETTAMGICNPVLGNKIGSIGLPMMDNDVCLLDLNNGGTFIKPGETGEIIIKSPTIMKEYCNGQKDFENPIKDGWLHTGDIAQMDEDGYFYILDRKEDVIKVDGFNVYLREVDEVLRRHPMVAEAIAVGLRDAYEGKKIKAFVVLNPGDKVTDIDIIDYCTSKLASYKVPQDVEFRDFLPRSFEGEIVRWNL